MKIVCLADTHGRHREIEVPSGDVLVHAGDLTRSGTLDEVEDFVAWVDRLPHRHKVLVAGNHDWAFERDPGRAAALLTPSIHYLEDTGCEIEGLNFWASPVQPWFWDMAFNRQRGDEIGRHWTKIPCDVDVLVTHAAPFGILDRIGNTQRGGCEMLRRRVEEVRPRLHVFGHLHDGHGMDRIGGAVFVNAAICDAANNPAFAPIVVDLPTYG